MNLLKLFKEHAERSVAQLNPLDHGATAQTVANQQYLQAHPGMAQLSKGYTAPPLMKPTDPIPTQSVNGQYQNVQVGQTIQHSLDAPNVATLKPKTVRQPRYALPIDPTLNMYPRYDELPRL